MSVNRFMFMSESSMAQNPFREICISVDQVFVPDKPQIQRLSSTGTNGVNNFRQQARITIWNLSVRVSFIQNVSKDKCRKQKDLRRPS